MRVMVSRCISLLLLASISWPFGRACFGQAANAAAEDVLRQAMTLAATGHRVDATALLARFADDHPEDDRVATGLAEMKLVDGDRRAAEDLLLRALEASPNSIAANDHLGQMLLEDGRYPEAMDRFETVLAVSFKDAPARAGELQAATQLALEAKASGKPQAALLCLEHAAEHLPGSVALLTDIGLVAAELKLYARAQRSLDAALAIDPHDARALYAAGRVATSAQHLPQAEQYLRAYLALRPDDATAFYGLGRVLAMQLRTTEARTAFERSVALAPLQSESFYELGVLAADAQDERRARELFTKTLARSPRHGGALTGLGQIAYRAKEYQAAREQLTAAVKSAPDYQPAHYYLGLTLARMGERAAATAELARASQLAAEQQSKAAPVPSEPGATP